jgi:hypothetical protein
MLKRLIKCLKISLDHKEFMESTTPDDFQNALEASVNCFATGKRPKKLEHLIFLNKFLQAHRNIPHDDLLCELWNKLGKLDFGRGQVTTPMYICDYMNNATLPNVFKEYGCKNPYFILDPACGSGIFAVSAYNLFHKHELWHKCVFHQVDIDLKCVYMTILNLLIRNFNAVVWHANALMDVEAHKQFNKPLQGWIMESGKRVSRLYKFTQEEAYDNFAKAFREMPDVQKGAEGIKNVGIGSQTQMFTSTN